MCVENVLRWEPKSSTCFDSMILGTVTSKYSVIEKESEVLNTAVIYNQLLYDSRVTITSHYRHGVSDHLQLDCFSTACPDQQWQQKYYPGDILYTRILAMSRNE